jgi:hypothetical protein
VYYLSFIRTKSAFSNVFFFHPVSTQISEHITILNEVITGSFLEPPHLLWAVSRKLFKGDESSVAQLSSNIPVCVLAVVRLSVNLSLKEKRNLDRGVPRLGRSYSEH